MPKKAGIVFVAVGAVLILSALLLLHHNRREDALAGEESARLLEAVEAAIPSAVPAATAGDAAEPAETPQTAELPVVEVEGYDCIGYLEIPALSLSLPVLSEWDYPRLRIAPCRQFGSPYTDDLVIAAHNYETHFGRLKELAVGERVIFTDMTGKINSYCVEKVETLQPDAVETVQESGYALVLYTCTKGGASRVAVFCSRAAE